MSEESSERSQTAPARPWLRPVLLIAALASLGVGAKLSGVLLSPGDVVQMVQNSGPWGLGVFVALVVAANLVQIPAWIFVGAAGTVWPFWQSAVVSFVACMLAATVTFEIFGRAGGTPLRGMDRPWIQKILSTIDARPIRGVAILRSVFFIAPPITVALALAGVRRRDHFLGTAAGIVLPLIAILLTAGAVGGGTQIGQ